MTFIEYCRTCKYKCTPSYRLPCYECIEPPFEDLSNRKPLGYIKEDNHEPSNEEKTISRIENSGE